MANFWKIVNDVIRDADVLLEVIDARLIDESRNLEIEEKVRRADKKLIIVMNKCDLVDKRYMDKVKKTIPNSVFVSAKYSLGTTILKKKILALGRKDKIIVGVIGYPNTGKSSIVNALAGRSKAKTSPQSGYTKGMQYVNAGPRISLIDTPGVIPFKENDEFLQAIISAKDFTMVKDPDVVAMKLIESQNGRIERHYNVKPGEDSEETLENIALQKNVIMKGSKPDIEKMSKIIIRDWQRGEID